MLEQTTIKALDHSQAMALNKRLATEWDSIRHKLLGCMLPYEELHAAMLSAGCQTTASDLNLDTHFYRQAVEGARYIRDRFSMLDVVDDSTGLAEFTARMPNT